MNLAASEEALSDPRIFSAADSAISLCGWFLLQIQNIPIFRPAKAQYLSTFH